MKSLMWNFPYCLFRGVIPLCDVRRGAGYWTRRLTARVFPGGLFGKRSGTTMARETGQASTSNGLLIGSSDSSTKKKIGLCNLLSDSGKTIDYERLSQPTKI